MGLVSYSESEDSDEEAPVVAKPAAPTAPPSKPAFQKTEPRKIKVDLPTSKPESSLAQEPAEPPAKRAKTAGAFGGFNSLLPAPKRAAPASSRLGKGVSLKTSSEAAFSRAAPTVGSRDSGDGIVSTGSVTEAAVPRDEGEKADTTTTDVKIVGRATRFKPLSVANKKKVSKKPSSAPADEIVRRGGPAGAPSHTEGLPSAQLTSEPAKKEKRSLFTVAREDAQVDGADRAVDVYEPLRVPEADTNEYDTASTSYVADAVQKAPVNSLEAVAADLNLTPAQRRQLFGRNAGAAVNVTHFDMENEYAANEEIRQTGETVEHRAVKSIAPGKHSLQQLVNNARSNQDSIEDKWAEGRQNRGEGGSKYGWSR